MKRSLPALAAIAAVSVAGVWIHAATRDGSRHAAAPVPTADIETVETVPAPAARHHAAPTPDAKAPARPMAAETGPRPPSASRDAEREHAAPSTARSSPGAAMRVALDPQTGQLVAPEHSGVVLTIEEMQALARQETEGLVTIHNADGSETLNHEGRFADFTVIRVGPDGKPTFMCVHSRPGVEHALRQPAPATPSTEDR